MMLNRHSYREVLYLDLFNHYEINVNDIVV